MEAEDEKRLCDGAGSCGFLANQNHREDKAIGELEIKRKNRECHLKSFGKG